MVLGSLRVVIVESMANGGLWFSTLVYLEGDASMRSYEDADGKRHSNLNIVQRTSCNALIPAGTARRVIQRR